MPTPKTQPKTKPPVNLPTLDEFNAMTQGRKQMSAIYAALLAALKAK